MSNYDAWKTESPEDEYERLNRWRRRDEEPAGAVSGVCACGVETESSVSGIGWQCRACKEAMLRRQFERHVRTA